jgi:5-methyltetrahydropteroyltriglutamate--homocysteine methyltransferase
MAAADGEKRDMAQRTSPPFRADHVGSLIRPQELREARQAHLEGKRPATELRALEDRSIREIVALQERVGLQAVTDGEFRRTSFREVLFESMDGFSKERVETDFSFSYADGSTRRATPVPKVVSRLRRSGSMAAGDFKFLKTVTKATPKVMLPAPSLAHWFVGDRVLAGSPYTSAREYMADIARIFREEIAELAALGCTYVQIDEVPIPVICDASVQATIAKRGEDAMALIDLYVDTINDAIRDRPSGMTVVVHMCRGNEGVAGLGSGGYEAIAERVFGRLRVDGYLLEYDTPRAGDFAPLRFLPREAIAVLGLISTKVTELETTDALKRRIDEAARVIDLDRLGLCPQCGFATLYRYDRMGLDAQERKLELLVHTARDIWG